MPVTQPPPSWAKITGKPTTVAGFGITDMATQTVANATNATNATAVPFSGVTDKPTTLTGYGITDEKCKAWVNFNGSGTVAIRASFNVSSITDNGGGDYTVNFTNAMQDANFSAVVTSERAFWDEFAGLYSLSTTGVRVINREPAVGQFDATIMCVSVFR